MKPSWWRCIFIYLAFSWNLKGLNKLANISWRISRIFASERTNMLMAAYCSGIMINARLNGQYEDEQ